MVRLAIITPVGPGHERYIEELGKQCRGFDHIVIRDPEGRIGRSAARNVGMANAVDADYIMFLDADDELADGFAEKVEAAIERHPDCYAILGLIAGLTSRGRPLSDRHGRRRHLNTVYGGWDELTDMPPKFCVSGLFRAAEAADHRFMAPLDHAEEIEFVLSFCAKYPFAMYAGPFTHIRCDRPSAVGPRGYTSLDWQAAAGPIMRYWRGRGRNPIEQNKRLARYWD